MEISRKSGARARESKSSSATGPSGSAGACITTSSDLGRNFPPIYYSEKAKDYVKPKLFRTGSAKFSAIEVPLGESINLYCEGGFQGYRSDRLTATCSRNNMYTVEGKNVPLKKLVCRKRQSAVAKLFDQQCSATGKYAFVFYKAGDLKLIVYVSCHDEKTGQNLWTRNVMGPVNAAYQPDVEREVRFTQDTLYAGIDVDKVYTRNSQMRTFAGILPGGSSDVSRLIVGNRFLARGHLMAKTDAVLENDQLATFKLSNVMPQFQSFNEGNWLRVEQGLRGFLNFISNELEVYTGTHGVMAYKGVELFLAIVGGKSRIPVPKFFYKIIVAKGNQAGVVIVGVNDVHATPEEVRQKYILCADVSSETDVLFISEKQRQRIDVGYVYACRVGDFVNHPDLKSEVPRIKNAMQMQILTKANANGNGKASSKSRGNQNIVGRSQGRRRGKHAGPAQFIPPVY